MNEPLIERGFAVVGAGAWLFGRAQPAAVRGTLTRRSLRGFICPDRGSLSVGELSAGDRSKRASRTFEGASGAVGKPPAAAFEGAAGAVPEPSNAAEGALERGSAAWCSSADHPFLTRLDCGAPVTAVSDKVLVAPASARTGAKLVKVIPFSFARSIRTTIFSHPEHGSAASNAADGGLERGEAASNARAAGYEPSNAAEGGLERGSAASVVMATRSRTTRIALADGESLGVRPEAAVAWTGPRPTGFCPRLRLLDVLLPRGPRDLLLHFHGPAIVWIEGSEPRPLHQMGPRKAVF